MTNATIELGGVKHPVTVSNLSVRAGEAIRGHSEGAALRALSVLAAAFTGLGDFTAAGRFADVSTGRPCPPVARRSTGSHKQNRRRTLAGRP